MRKKLYRTAVPFALSVVLLSSCVPFIYDDDDSVASGKIDTFLTAIEKEIRRVSKPPLLPVPLPP
jgi:hypothetical protein